MNLYKWILPKLHMKTIISHIYSKIFHKKIFPKYPNPLGRWNLEECHIKIDRKIDYSNIDHCGPCGIHSFTHTYPHRTTPPKS